MNVLVDTCVIIDALQHREPFAKDSEAVCLAVARGDVFGFITAKSISDIYYILRRALHNDARTREVLKNLCLSFGILDTTAMDCRNALTSTISDFEDAIMVETGLRNHVDCIVTRNIKDYEKAPLTLYTPTEFLPVINQ